MKRLVGVSEGADGGDSVSPSGAGRDAPSYRRHPAFPGGLVDPSAQDVGPSHHAVRRPPAALGTGWPRTLLHPVGRQVGIEDEEGASSWLVACSFASGGVLIPLPGKPLSAYLVDLNLVIETSHGLSAAVMGNRHRLVFRTSGFQRG